MNYLPEKQLADIRVRVIHWAAYKEDELISREDFQTISALDKSPETFFIERPEESVRILLHLLRALYTEIEAIQTILVLIDDMTTDEFRDRIGIFHQYGGSGGDDDDEDETDVWGPFLNLMKHQDSIVMCLAIHILAKLASYSRERMPATEQNIYFVFIKNELHLNNPKLKEFLPTKIHCLQMMLTIEDYRNEFMKIDGLTTLVKLLPQMDFQIQYQIIFCFWVLTFTSYIVVHMSKYNTIPTLAGILNECSKEKLIRIIFAYFRNLLEKTNDEDLVMENCAIMVHCDVHSVLYNQQQRYIHDDDHREHVAYLSEKLSKAVEKMCSFTQYAAEVRSRELSWTPVHNSLKFWSENATRLNDNNYELLRILIELLEKSTTSLVLAVALHDIGQYVRKYSEGKNVLDSLGGKVLVLELLEHEDEEVRYEALMTGAQLLRVQ